MNNFNSLKYHFKINKDEEGGYWASCLEMPGVITQGDTMQELEENMRDAINTAIEEPADSTELAPLPDKHVKLSKSVVEVSVDPLVASAFHNRLLRLKEIMTMKYKGYTGKVEYDDEAQIFHGSINGIKDIITFQGTSVNELEQALKDSVEEYLDWCKKEGREPQCS